MSTNQEIWPKASLWSDKTMIGNNISSIRKQRGFKLSELSEKTGISKSYLSNIERNLKQNPSIHVMERIAAVLNVDLKSLLKISIDVEIKHHLEKEYVIRALVPYRVSPSGRNKYHSFIHMTHYDTL